MSENTPRSRAKRGGSARPLGSSPAGPSPESANGPSNRTTNQPVGNTTRAGQPDLPPPSQSPRLRSDDQTRLNTPVISAGAGVRQLPSGPTSTGSRSHQYGEYPTTTQPPVTPQVSPRVATSRPYSDAERGPRHTPQQPTDFSTSAPTRPPITSASPLKPRRKRSPGKRLIAGLLIILMITAGWIIGIGFWANSQLARQDVLTGASATPGTTYLLAGSDSRAGDVIPGDTTAGQRADTIMLVHVAENGHATLVSLPRDTLVSIPGKGTNKLNAAYAFGGSKLLVQTVEGLTGMTIDHFVEVGFAGVENIVNALGTVNVCLEQDVNDPASGLNLTKGCHDVDGKTALAFVRVRHFDPTADLGRQLRQQEFIRSLSKAAGNVGTLVNPFKQLDIAKAATGSLTVDQNSNIIDLARLGLAFREATGPNGTVGKIPWVNPNFNSRVGSAIKIDPDAVKAYFKTILDGTIPAGKSN